MKFPWNLSRQDKLNKNHCAACPIPGKCGVKRCLANQLRCSPNDLAEFLRSIGPAFVALQNRSATLGARLDLQESVGQNLPLLDDGQLLIDIDRLLATCKLVTISADQPLVEFDCGPGAERLLIHPESRQRLHVVREFLCDLDVAEERMEPSQAVRWLDDFPGQSSEEIALPPERCPAESATSSLTNGSQLRIRMVTAFAEWKKQLHVSSVDYLDRLMVIRSRRSVAYCPRLLDSADQSFSLSRLPNKSSLFR